MYLGYQQRDWFSEPIKPLKIECLLCVGLNSVQFGHLLAIFSPDWFNEDRATFTSYHLDVV